MKVRNSYKSMKILQSMTPAEFIRLVEKKPSSIVSSKIMLPKLGSDNLNSRFVVEIEHS